ncbi:hypothetical protein TREES_T100002594 [Tupaia chinensis]|uniref:Uncharacterized protein n=1 Tax=Tupaia chinensis TaxID=246437 RepID=L9L5P6_TUPCH|nr:hypothetical protein TREES_T100002594 [Tupaia chinensis]
MRMGSTNLVSLLNPSTVQPSGRMTGHLWTPELAASHRAWAEEAFLTRDVKRLQPLWPLHREHREPDCAGLAESGARSKDDVHKQCPTSVDELLYT